MKRKVYLSLMSIFALLLIAGNAFAYVQMDFTGSFVLSNDDGEDSFAETLAFNVFPGFPMSGIINEFTPPDDSLFLDDEDDADGINFPYTPSEYIVLPILTLDVDNYDSGERYGLVTTEFLNGFQVFDEDDTLLFQGDVNISNLMVDAQTASINPYFMVNIMNISAGDDYVLGRSSITDAFLNSGGGAFQITMQFGVMDIVEAIEALGNGESYSNTYSGTVSPTPEPGTLVLLGVGLIGLAVFRRRMKQ